MAQRDHQLKTQGTRGTERRRGRGLGGIEDFLGRLPTYITTLAIGLFAAALQCVRLPGAGEAVLRGPLADDAYYVLEVARNLAHGDGITSNGQLTNGFQPAHFLLAFLVGEFCRWDLYATPALLVRAMVVVYYAGGCAALGLLIDRVVPLVSQRIRIGCLVGLLWSGGVGTTTAFLGLETPMALCAWILILVAALDYRFCPTLARACIFGAVCGLGFLARNDVVVLILAVGAILLVEQLNLRAPRWGELAAAAFVCVVLASPWLGYNLATSGQLVPQSGAAEALGSLYDLGRGIQLQRMATTIGRYLAVIPLPFDRLSPWLALVLALLVIAGQGCMWTLGQRMAPRNDALAFAVRAALVGAIGISVIYGLLFGAPHMLLRWLAPWSLPALLLVVRWRTFLLDSSRVAWLGGVLSFVVAAGLRAAQQPGSIQTNTYVLARYLAEDCAHQRVGTLQSGLPAWLRPDVVNLDGKMNRDVLRAIRRGQFGAWLVASDVEVVVDWELFGLERDPLVLNEFELRHGPSGLWVLTRRESH